MQTKKKRGNEDRREQLGAGISESKRKKMATPCVKTNLSDIQMIRYPYSKSRSQKIFQFTIATWNVLADCYAFPSYYPHCLEHLQWDTRFPCIISHIKEANADILCLQEVDHWDDYLAPLQNIGYDCLYLQRTGGRNDGCAICFKSDKIRLVNRVDIFFDDLCNLPFKDSLRLKKHCIALIGIFRPFNKSDQQLSEGIQDHDFCVATTHIFWNPSFEDVKCRQVHYLMERLEQFWPRKDRLFLCGDFNSIPSSAIAEFMRSGSVDLRAWKATMISGERISGNCEECCRYFTVEDDQEVPGSLDDNPQLSDLFLRIQSPILRHLYTLKSVYHPYAAHMKLLRKEDKTHLKHKIKKIIGYDSGSYEPITSHFTLFTGTLDYMFFTKGIMPVAYRRLPLMSELSSIGFLPNASFASDHILLMAEVALVTKTPKKV